MTLCLDLPDSGYEMVELTGAWARERHVTTRPLVEGVQAVYSLRGHSSHHFNPSWPSSAPTAAKWPGRSMGSAWCTAAISWRRPTWTPNHVTRVTMGIHPQNFRWTLRPGETFATPEAVMVYSDRGLNGMSQTYHQLYRTRLARGVWRDKVRPVLVNNWEATYFAFNEEKLLTLAAQAKALASSCSCWTTAGSPIAAMTAAAWATGKWTPPSCPAA